MTYRVPAYDPNLPIVIIDIGNTTTAIATWNDGELKTPLSFPTHDEKAISKGYSAQLGELPDASAGAVVIGSVVKHATQSITRLLSKIHDKDPLIVGNNIPFPIDVSVKDHSAIGVDRVCAAATAYDRLKTSCTVIDFGSAITVDLIDDEGTLRGGAILPGLNMQLQALHKFTAALPNTKAIVPNSPFGRDTQEAMCVGVYTGITGAVRAIVESYATSLNHWPQVIATGGDIDVFTHRCDFIDTAVDHLVLHGIALAYEKHVKALT